MSPVACGEAQAHRVAFAVAGLPEELARPLRVRGDRALDRVVGVVARVALDEDQFRARRPSRARVEDQLVDVAGFVARRERRPTRDERPPGAPPADGRATSTCVSAAMVNGHTFTRKRLNDASTTGVLNGQSTSTR